VGGEEFIIVLPGLERQGALAVLERLRQRLAESHLGAHPRFTANFGLTDSTEAESLEQLLQIADSALYASKAAGRDRVTIGAPPLDPPMPATRPVAPDESTAQETRTRRRQPALYAAAEEEDPPANGLR
jgi:hypothetical protein